MARVDNISTMRMISNTSCRFSSPVVFDEICINELVDVTIEDELENNQKMYTTTATFQTKDKKPLTERRMAFRLTANDGKRYMIGTYGRPYPIIKENNPFPDDPKDSSMKTVTITWKATVPMLLILE